MIAEMKTMVEHRLLESAEIKTRAATELSQVIAHAGLMIANKYRAGSKLVIFGNGGSAADAQHCAAELVGRFQMERSALPAIALTVDTSALTSIGNDYGFDKIFSRQAEAFVRPDDVALAISTSGNSPNVLEAISTCRRLGADIIGLTGKDGGAMREMCDLCIIAPSSITARIQEVHIAVIHILCEIVECALFGKDGTQ